MNGRFGNVQLLLDREVLPGEDQSPSEDRYLSSAECQHGQRTMVEKASLHAR
jgi:hypothetical protein